MRVVTHCICSTVGITASVRQVDSAFSRVLVERAGRLPEFKRLGKLAIFTTMGSSDDKPKRRIRQGTYYITLTIPYKAWSAANWPARVDLMAAAFLAGVEEAPKKRIFELERAALRNIAESTRVDARNSPPAYVEKM